MQVIQNGLTVIVKKKKLYNYFLCTEN